MAAPAAGSGGSDDLAALLTRLDSADDVAEGAAAVVAHAVTLAGVDLAAVVATGRHGERVLLAATGPLPDVRPPAAPDEGAVLAVRDTARDGRWPTWLPGLAEAGLGAALLVGLPLLRERSATLELYARSPGTAPDDATAAALGRHAGRVLRHLDRTDNLREALAHRTVIGQAQGLVMARYGLSAEQAMRFLRRTSQQSQLPVRDLAAATVREHEQRLGS